MTNILIVEDETHLAQGLKFNLEIEGYNVFVCSSAEEAVEVFNQYDMMILDIMLPGMSGIDLLKLIRSKDNKYPVLILSAKISDEDMINGLSAGADDYMIKPFSLKQLILRIKRILERQSWYFGAILNQNFYKFGDYSIDFSKLEAETNNGIKKITPYEGYIMKYLIENQGRVISRSELLEKVWGDDHGMETRTIDIFIARLRKLFEEDRKKPKHIISIRGVGYQFFA